MENAAARTAEMTEQAKAAIATARFHEMLAQKTTKVVAGTLALGLREQGLSDTAIGEVLGVSRNRITDLVNVGIWPRVAGDVPLFRCEERDAIEAGVSTLCKPLIAQESGWIHTRTGRGQDLLEENKVPLPYAIGKRPGLLDAEAAQFDNQSSGERILVYTFERHYGEMLYDSNLRQDGPNGKGYYRIELCSAAGGRHELPLELLGIDIGALRFGSKWPNPRHRNDIGDAFRNALAAVRGYYGIWPLPAHLEDKP